MTLMQHALSLFAVLPESIRPEVILGGGCLRAHFDGTEIKDIDCFFRTHEDYLSVADILDDEEGWERADSPNGVTNFTSPSGHLVSLIGFEFGDALAHAERFDFRCCAHVAAYVSQTLTAVLSLPGAEDDAHNRLLYVLNNNGTERTLRRIQHYVEDYGYSLHPEQEVEPEQGDLFDDIDGHMPQGVRPEPARLPEPEYLVAARRRVRSLPVTSHGY